TADIPAFEAAAQKLLAQNINFQETRLTVARANRAVRPFVVALWLFALLAALVGGMVLAQTVARQHRIDGRDDDLLRALGMSDRPLVILGALRGLCTGLLAAVFALPGAWLASYIMPIGPLHAIDPVHGRTVDGTVFIIGAIAIILLLTLHGALVAAV